MIASITDLLAAASPRLTPIERHLAELIAADPTIVAFGSIADLAASADVSRPSVNRFAVKLGFEHFAELQAHVRTEMTTQLQLKRPSDRMRRRRGRVAPIVDIQEALAQITSESDGDKITAAGAKLARARAVWLLSGETSIAGAGVLLSGLSMLRAGVVLVDDRSLVHHLASVARDDVAVALGFYRYRRWAVEATEALADQGARIIAITDGPLSPLANRANVRFDLTIPAVGPFDSSVPPVAIAELLVSAAATDLGKRAVRRIDKIEQMWADASTFVPDP